MRFHRFTQLGFLSNWGWYSPQEQALLDKEDEVGKYLASLEDFVRLKPPVKGLMVRFKHIQTLDNVKSAEYGAFFVELKEMAVQAKNARLKVLNQGGADVPDAPRTFPNHHPDALVGEIRSFLEYRKQNRSQGDPFQSGFVIHFNKSSAANFHAVIASGSKVLYTLDVDGILSVGDPRSTKHSVVAVGKTCKAAGTAQLAIDDRTDLYKSMKYHEQTALALRSNTPMKGVDSVTRAANAEYQEQQAEELRIQLQGYVPPVVVTRRVLLDFDSGHYAPDGAWKEAMGAWIAAGYKPEWNPESRRV